MVAGGAAAGGGVFGGGVCADDWGTAAIIAESAITIAQYLIWTLLGRPPVSRCCNIRYMRPAGALPILYSL